MRALRNAVPFFSGNFPMKTPSRIYNICSLISACLINTAVPNTSRSTLLAKQPQYHNTSGTRTHKYVRVFLLVHFCVFYVAHDCFVAPKQDLGPYYIQLSYNRPDAWSITRVIIWLAPRAIKMNQIALCDWLPERASWSQISWLPPCPARKNSTKAI